MGIRINAGYRIIETVRIETSLEVVLGVLEGSHGTQYVTWQCRNGIDYFWGHYFLDFDAARRNLFERVLSLLPEGGNQNAAE